MDGKKMGNNFGSKGRAESIFRTSGCKKKGVTRTRKKGRGLQEV